MSTLGMNLRNGLSVGLPGVGQTWLLQTKSDLEARSTRDVKIATSRPRLEAHLGKGGASCRPEVFRAESPPYCPANPCLKHAQEPLQ